MEHTKKLGFTIVLPYNGENGFLGKIYDWDDGQIVSQKQRQISAYYCIYQEYQNMREIQDVYNEMYEQNDFALILGKPKHVKAEEEFLLFSEARLCREFHKGKKHDCFEYDGMKCFARTEANFEPVNLMLFDYDCDKSTPAEHRFETHYELTGAIGKIIPNINKCSHIITESSSSGIAHERNPDQLLKSRKWHILVEVEDPDDIHRFSRAFMQNAWKQGIAWRKISKSKARLDRTIIDRSVLHPARIVYEGRPLLNGGLTQAIHKPIFNDGEPLDTRTVPLLRQGEVKTIAKTNGLKKMFVFNPSTGKKAKHYLLDTDNTYLPILTNATTFLKYGDRNTLYTVKDFIESGDEEWRIVSEFRCGTLEEMKKRDNASEALYLQTDGKIVIHEYDGNIRYIKSSSRYPQLNNITGTSEQQGDPRDKHVTKGDETEDTKTYEGNEIDLLGNLTKSERHLVFGIAGQGKSRKCLALAEEGYAVIFACATNKQAEEQHRGFLGSKSLALSKRYYLKQNHDVELVNIATDSPWDGPSTNEQATIRNIMVRYPSIGKDNATDIYKSCGDIAAPIEKGTVLFTTLDRVKIMGLKGELIPSQENGIQFSTLKKLVVVVDDVEYDAISTAKKVTDATRRWILGELKAGNRHEIRTQKKVDFVIRDKKHTLEHALRGVRTVFTTVEKHTVSQLDRLYGDNLMIHDMTSSDGKKHPHSNLYVFGTKLVRKRYHSVIAQLVEKWRQQVDDIIFIADGVHADENHYCIRGSNSYENTTVITKISQPHRHKIFQIEVDHGDAEYSTREVALEVMLSVAEQSIGRNQGMRHHGNVCIAMVDVGFLDDLVSYSSVEVTWHGKADKFAMLPTHTKLTAQVAEDLCDPLAALCIDKYKTPTSYDPEVEKAIKQIETEHQKIIEKENDLLGLMLRDLLHTKSSVGDIMKTHNASRYFDVHEYAEIKSYLKLERLRPTAIDYFISGRRRREFEREHNLSRVIPDACERNAFWRDIEIDIEQMS